MAPRGRRWLSDAQKADLYECWKNGESMSDAGPVRVNDFETSVFAAVAFHDAGGARRQRLTHGGCGVERAGEVVACRVVALVE